ncbi:putative ferric-chelate reductase 1 isoform X2 [Octopus bimaculoides]|uniref:putative ferric-chelate reductase 1 isoform X2 n=1 Tax=Octopus bimaculoides TaxID=37653 RepID=UPI0022E89A70|nr:putative ferric-chelate reductase 1 isoform X2 [Octopus bimaculoides]
MSPGREALHLTALVITLLVGLYVPTVISRSNGAPNCEDLAPKHHNKVAQTSDPPYSVDFSPQDFKGGDTITVTINGTAGKFFRGFVIAARTDNSNVNYGTFTAVQRTKSVNNCLKPNSALTHTSKELKSSLSFNWTSPINIPSGLHFDSSVVESYSVFWTNLRTPLTTTPSVTTDMPVTPTSVPGKISNTWKCSENFECQISWIMDKASKTTNFEFNFEVTTDRSYIALGLSEDTDMGSDSVMECLYHNGNVKGQYSYNERIDNSKVTDLILNNGRYDDGLMTCNFTRDNVMNNSKIFDIGQKQWYLLVAAGPVKDGFVKRKHTFTATSNSRIDFLKQDLVVSEESEILTHLHGVSMIVAWVFFGSVGIFAARYSKSINKKLCKIMLWFQLHRTFMVLAMLLTILGFILIFIQNEGEYSELHSTSAKAHPIIGIIVTIFVIVNPILGYFRPGKDHPKRIYFNWVHSMIGTVLMILADVTIFIGVLMHSKMEGVNKMYKAFVIEMSLFLVYKFVAGCGMEIMEYCNQDEEKAEEDSIKQTFWNRLTDKVSSYEMSTPGQNKPPELEVNKEEKVKTIMLLVHTVICLAFTIALIATLFMNP